MPPRMSAKNWKEALDGRVSPEMTAEIDAYETQLALRKQGKIEEKLFAETRLRRGVYGQRYDNGQRHDGVRTQTLPYAPGSTKGPNTLWDAPGMQRIKIPFGGLKPEQLETIAELSEEYADGICHVTTRQDFQLHFVHIDDTPDIMRRLAAASITTREACGNSVRNVTACPLSGVCRDETFDCTPYARGMAYFLLGHPDCQDFGRKFKFAFSGCAQHPCALTTLHDFGGVAKTKTENGKERRGFRVTVGGGLGSVPHQAKLFDEFVPEGEMLPLAQAVSRVFGRLGEKKNRARARIKFLVAKLGIDEFKRLVQEERAKLPPDPRWTAFLRELDLTQEKPSKLPSKSAPGPHPEGFEAWKVTNVYEQRQAGYAVATITLPLGDLTAAQMRSVADLARRYSGGHLRTTVEQNIVLRWVTLSDLPLLYQDLKAIGLAQAGAGTIVDVVACPGTDTCKLGISSSRGLAGELRTRLAEQSLQFDESVRDLRIKISGCFNACGQHHVADIGFYGVSRKVGSYTVPHFQLVLGGQWSENAAAYGLAMVAVPSKAVPATVSRLTDAYLHHRERGESFQGWVKRTGKAAIRTLLEDLLAVPPHDQNPDFYTDWADAREFTIGDMGTGECAGEVVPFVEFELSAAEREAFEAQVLLDKGEPTKAAEKAYAAMLRGAKALIRIQFQDISDDPNTIVREFKERFDDTKKFHDPFMGGKFAAFLPRVHSEGVEEISPEQAHQRVEEANLFIDAAHACYLRMSNLPVAMPVRA
jgi:sulfite reductase (ferredoxin)